ncbi:MAG: histidine-type phosphatase [Clostridia bacterium]|nr:histidine-type phosphatase [Clostridia bacterium]
MTKKTTGVLLAIVSLLLLAALAVQCLFWAGILPAGDAKAPSPSGETPYTLSRDGYTLEQVVILSRHNIRSPLSGSGSLLDRVTPHKWFEWSSGASELSLRGGALETVMGQYFRKWMEEEGLFPQNYRPEDGAVRIYANSKQRTIATAEYFLSGLLPTANLPVEYHMEFDKMDPVFTPQLTFVTPAYRTDAEAEIRTRFAGAISGLADCYALLSDVTGLKDSDARKDGTVGPLVTDDLTLKLELGAEPGMTGSLKTACSISDALVLQYYEEPDDRLAAFGRKLSGDEWKKIARIKDVYGDVLFTAPLIAPNVAHPLLQEIASEMETDGRRFTFLCGHDSNIGSVLASLGVTEYSLPETIEKTPIGCKLVFSKWRAPDGRIYRSADLVYQSTEQLRNLSLLDTAHPPVIFPVVIPGVERNADGLYPADAFSARLSGAIAEYDRILAEYALDAAA